MEKIEQYKLIVNARYRNEEWKNTLLQVLSGEYESDQDRNIKQQPGMTYCNSKEKELQEEIIGFLYDGIDDNYTNSEWLIDRFILFPINENTNEMNERLIYRIQGEETIS